MTREELETLCEQQKKEIAQLKNDVLKWKRIRTPTHGTCCTCQACGLDHDSCRCDLDDVATDLEEAMSALECIMTGGNHLALQITNSFGEHPPYAASFDDAMQFYGVGVQGWDGNAWKYDVWVCWKLIMQARPLLQAWQARQKKETA